MSYLWNDTTINLISQYLCLDSAPDLLAKSANLKGVPKKLLDNKITYE